MKLTCQIFDEVQWKSQQLPVRLLRCVFLYIGIDSTNQRLGRHTIHNVYPRRRPGFHLYNTIPGRRRRIYGVNQLSHSKKYNHTTFCGHHLSPWVRQMIIYLKNPPRTDRNAQLCGFLVSAFLLLRCQFGSEARTPNFLWFPSQPPCSLRCPIYETVNPASLLQ